MFGIVRPRNAETVQLSRTHIGQKNVPALIGTFRNWNANVLFGGLAILAQAKLTARSVLGRQSEVHAAPHPCGAEGTRKTAPGSYWRHKRPRTYAAPSPPR